MTRSIAGVVLALVALTFGSGAVLGGQQAHEAEPMPFRHIIIDSDNPTYPHCKAVGDINGDGFADVLAASAYGQGLYWYAYPNWTKHRIAGGSFTTDMQVGDVDRDGDLDVIIPPVGTGLVWFENPRTQGKTPAANANFAWARNDGRGNFTIHTNLVPASGDFLQGCTTIFTAYRRREVALSWHRANQGIQMFTVPKDPATAKLHIFENADGKGGQWKDHVISIGAEHHDGAILADMDNDGDPDILSIGWRHNRVLLYENQAIAPSARPIAADKPSSFVLFDLEITHRGDRQLYSNWDFQTHRKTNPEAPTDWREGNPSLSDAGIYHWRVEMVRLERAWKSPMHIQFGWWNIPQDPVIRHIASPALTLTHLEPPAPGQPWVYELVGTVRALDVAHMYYGKGPKQDKHVTDWDWSRAFAPDTAYTLINPRKNDLDSDKDGKISEAEYPDLEIRTVLTLHRPDSPAYESLRARLPKLKGAS